MAALHPVIVWVETWLSVTLSNYEFFITLLTANTVRMVKLTEEMITARTRVSDMSNVRKLSCWGSNLDDVSVLRTLKNVETIALRF